jgi:cytoskeletal protein CcmA (bactofilin family)
MLWERFKPNECVVDGTVEGPIEGKSVVLKSQAHVVGDIHHQSLTIEKGAFFDGHSVQIRENGQAPENSDRKWARQIASRETKRRVPLQVSRTLGLSARNDRSHFTELDFRPV